MKDFVATTRLEVHGAVATVTLNRPDKLNALSGGVLDELFAVVSELDARAPHERPRVLVLASASDRAFAAGADISELGGLDSDLARELSERGHRLGRALDAASFPSIAAVNGFALGGGLELALCTDLIVCSDKARFGQPEINLGLIPGFGGTFRLAARVGSGRARKLIFTGETIDATRAEAIGLVDAVYPHAEFSARVSELAHALAEKAPLALGAAKQCLLANQFQPYASAAALEAKRFGALFATLDAREGIDAFLAKRKASFVGR
ncbi:MAG: enoyl-CoA hydratase/isomerase family protein [Myxococcota bacterium]